MVIRGIHTPAKMEHLVSVTTEKDTAATKNFAEYAGKVFKNFSSMALTKFHRMVSVVFENKKWINNEDIRSDLNKSITALTNEFQARPVTKEEAKAFETEIKEMIKVCNKLYEGRIPEKIRWNVDHVKGELNGLLTTVQNAEMPQAPSHPTTKLKSTLTKYVELANDYCSDSNKAKINDLLKTDFDNAKFKEVRDTTKEILEILDNELGKELEIEGERGTIWDINPDLQKARDKVTKQLSNFNIQTAEELPQSPEAPKVVPQSTEPLPSIETKEIQKAKKKDKKEKANRELKDSLKNLVDLSQRGLGLKESMAKTWSRVGKPEYSSHNRELATLLKADYNKMKDDEILKNADRIFEFIEQRVKPKVDDINSDVEEGIRAEFNQYLDQASAAYDAVSERMFPAEGIKVALRSYVEKALEYVKITNPEEKMELNRLLKDDYNNMEAKEITKSAKKIIKILDVELGKNKRMEIDENNKHVFPENEVLQHLFNLVEKPYNKILGLQ